MVLAGRWNPPAMGTLTADERSLIDKGKRGGTGVDSVVVS